MWGGVCNGIAAYMGLDVTWVRIGLVVLTLFTGVTLLVYIAMLVIVPYADTAEDRAAAFGVPFNTEDIISRAKKNFDESSHRWQPNGGASSATGTGSSRDERRSCARPWRTPRRRMSPMSQRGIMTVFLPIAAIVGAVAVRRLIPRDVFADHAAQHLRPGAAARQAAVDRIVAARPRSMSR